MAQEYIRTIIMGTGRWPYTGGGLLFLDNIEGTFEWTGSGTGADYVVERASTHAYEDDYSLYLKTRITAPAAGDSVQGARYVGLVPEKSLMLSAFFLPTSGADIAYLYFRLTHFDGATASSGRVRYDWQNNIWQYYNSSGAYENISGSDQDLYEDAWHSLALSVNFSTSKYVSVITDGTQISLTEDIYQVGSVSLESLQIVLRLETVGATEVETYYDNVSVNIV